MKTTSHNVGVIIGRFQSPYLHEGHLELINQVLTDHPRALIVLGLSPTKGTITNPLDYQARKQMILETFPPAKFPNLEIAYVKDCVSDKVWSDNLDKIVNDHLGANDTAVLYGGRDSFISHYKGNLPTRELVASRQISASEIRDAVSKASQSSPDFRRGAIWATYQRYPAVYPTVDVAVFDPENKRVLVARKSGEKDYRFVGGFVGPKDASFEAAALRELAEETGLTVGFQGLRYIGSHKVDDWRYRNTTDAIITQFYVGLYSEGAPSAADDIAEVRWIPYERLYRHIFVEEHKPLADMLTQWVRDEYDLPIPVFDGKILPA